jgi:DNA-directed RNA polymerase subunit RPC12/RpoP
MVLYTCNDCEKEFTLKGNFNTHINRKKSCIYTQNDFKCQYCNKKFTKKYSMLRHINNSCKQKNNLNENNIIKLKELELKEKEINNSKELKEKELILKGKEIELKEKEFKLKEKELNLKISKNEIKQNNITNNINNNITCNINIVAFGSENLENIPNKKILSFINRGFMSVIQMVNYLNCNKDLPENNNIYISNKRDNNINLYNGKKWIIQEKDSTLNTILNKNGNFLEKKYNEFSIPISTFEQFKNGRYNEEQNEFMKEKLNKLLYNNRDLFIKKNIKKNILKIK